LKKTIKFFKQSNKIVSVNGKIVCTRQYNCLKQNKITFNWTKKYNNKFFYWSNKILWFNDTLLCTKQLNLLSKMIISFNKTQILFKENDKFVSHK